MCPSEINDLTKSPLPPEGKVHFVGIGGAGLSAIARLMTEQGFEVSGCDIVDSLQIESLRERGIPIEIGHQPSHLDIYKPDALVISSAITPDNAEVKAAQERKVPVYKRADILGLLMKNRTGIAVAGTHGKTTTTAMVAFVLTECGLKPTFIVGGVMANYGTNARAGDGKPFVIEADEYDRMFLGLRPQITVLTTLEMDHPDMFADLDEVRALFRQFVDLLPADGLLIAGHDDPETLRIAKSRLLQSRPALTYGLTGGTWTATQLTINRQGGMSFEVRNLGFKAAQVALQVPGKHNVQNALAALALAAEMGIPIRHAAEALSNFSGVQRRFEVKGQPKGVTIIDDYAHHPTAIRATLAAARSRYGERPIWAVWQPHTYSRTKALLDEFAASFKEADHVIITDVYRSRDKETFGVGPNDVLERMPDHPDARHIGPLDQVVAYLADHVKRGDVVITLTAGDATKVGDELQEILEARHDHAPKSKR